MRYLKSTDRLKTRNSPPPPPLSSLCPSLAFHPSPNTITFYTHRKSAVPPRSPILPFRRIQLHTIPYTESFANLVTREAFTWPSPYSRSGEIPKKRTHLGGSRRVLALHVGCGTTSKEKEREKQRERERALPSSPSPRTMLHLGPWYTGIGRDPDVSEVRPHPALCPAHVTVVRVVIRVNVWPMNPSTT